MNVKPIFETPFERKGIVTPGVPILPKGTERHPVPGGGSRALSVSAGDQICVLDFDGLQPGELVFFAPDKTSNGAYLGVKGSGRPNGVINTLANGSKSGQKVLHALKKSGFDLAVGDGVQIFSEGSSPGDMAHFTAECDGLLIIATVGNPMAADTQKTLTDLIFYLKRSSLEEIGEELLPPDPLANPILDINIQPGVAETYEVNKGQYIQVLDVKGRECSDFQAFSLRALDQGLERDIDPTTTRSLMGNLYPEPGIFSKYLSVDQEPLVEIVQDTCGRHDTFGLACTARYYEDLGYPGHLNCSDNITEKLKSYNVRPRAGWPAINFFFNTMLDEANAITMDEPWSRPGDYVMLRALTDLVCVSSACPCDIDPANGWVPTDIQVRTYKTDETFKKSIGYRKSTEAEVEETKKTGFHDCFAKHTRDFVEYNGYWLPNTMTNYGAISEYWSCRDGLAVMDLSPLRKYEVTGPDAEELMQMCVTRNVKKLSIGQVVYTAMCYEHGGMIDDGTIYRLGNENFRWIGGNDTSGLWLKEQAVKNNLNAWVRNSTDQLHNIALQGRHSKAVLSKVFWTPPTQPTVDELGWFRLTIARIGDVHGKVAVISRTGYSGELGYEIFCHPKDANEIFDSVWKAGEEYGITPLGLEALDMLRIEGGLIFAGSEFDDQTDPYEAGIGFTVPLKSKTDNFIGRAAITERKEHPHRKLVGLEITGGLVPSPGDCIRLGKAQIGEVTSAVKSPILGKVIALGRVSISHSKIGAEVQIGQLDGHQKRINASVCSFPHFDPTKERVKGNYEV